MQSIEEAGINSGLFAMDSQEENLACDDMLMSLMYGPPHRSSHAAPAVQPGACAAMHHQRHGRSQQQPQQQAQHARFPGAVAVHMKTQDGHGAGEDVPMECQPGTSGHAEAAAHLPSSAAAASRAAAVAAMVGGPRAAAGGDTDAEMTDAQACIIALPIRPASGSGHRPFTMGAIHAGSASNSGADIIARLHPPMLKPDHDALPAVFSGSSLAGSAGHTQCMPQGWGAGKRASYAGAHAAGAGFGGLAWAAATAPSSRTDTQMGSLQALGGPHGPHAAGYGHGSSSNTELRALVSMLEQKQAIMQQHRQGQAPDFHRSSWGSSVGSGFGLGSSSQAAQAGSQGGVGYVGPSSPCLLSSYAGASTSWAAGPASSWAPGSSNSLGSGTGVAPAQQQTAAGRNVMAMVGSSGVLWPSSGASGLSTCPSSTTQAGLGASLPAVRSAPMGQQVDRNRLVHLLHNSAAAYRGPHNPPSSLFVDAKDLLFEPPA